MTEVPDGGAIVSTTSDEGQARRGCGRASRRLWSAFVRGATCTTSTSRQRTDRNVSAARPYSVDLIGAREPGCSSHAMKLLYARNPTCREHAKERVVWLSSVRLQPRPVRG